MKAIIRVIIADDHDCTRNSLEQLLATAPAMKLVAMANDGKELLELARQWQPDIVVTDIKMPGINGIKATRRLTVSYPQIKIIIFSRCKKLAVINRAIQAGAKGYVMKISSINEVLWAIETVTEGLNYYCDNTLIVMEEGKRSVLKNNCGIAIPQLTARENEIIKYIRQGLNDKQMAGRMGIVPRTVESHKEKIRLKLGIKNNSAIMKFAFDHNLSSLLVLLLRFLPAELLQEVLELM